MSNSAVKSFCKVYALFFKYVDLVLPSLVLFVFRFHWGLAFFHDGKAKLENHEKVAEFFASLGIPAADLQAWFVSGLECVGGVLLLVGLFSRPIALLLTGNMIVAYLSVPDDRATVLNVWNDAEPFLQATPFFYLLTSVLILAFGPGAISLDRVWTRFKGSGSK